LEIVQEYYNVITNKIDNFEYSITLLLIKKYNHEAIIVFCKFLTFWEIHLKIVLLDYS